MIADVSDRHVSSFYPGSGLLEPIVEATEEFYESTTDVESETKDIAISPIELETPLFEPEAIMLLDISKICDALKSIFLNGSFPDWLRNFKNLRTLKAQRCGIVVVDPWIVELAELHEIYLEHNLISTWPHFLRNLPELEYICLDGNPCLEKAFCKSPTLRSLFFNWGPSKDSYKLVPRYVRGPEWPAAANARMSISLNIGYFGCYFGGIYTLSTPPETSNDGFLTPIEPCPLQTRVSRAEAYPESLEHVFRTCAVPDSGPHQPPDWHKVRQFEILLNIFNDIDILLQRDEKRISVERSEKYCVPITGNIDISLKSMHISHQSDTMKKIDVYGILWGLLKEEEQYCGELRKIVKGFFSPRISSTTVVSSLSTIFEWFPVLCSSHHKIVYPALRSLVSATGNKRSHSIEKEIDMLCKSLLQVQNVYEWYARKLNVSECYLDIPSSSSGLYRNAELHEYVRKQVMKLGGINGYFAIQFPNGSSSNTIDLINRRKSFDVFKSKKEEGPVGQWAAKVLSKPNCKIEKHPIEYIYIPLLHVVRYERIFTALSHMDSRFDSIKAACREIRRHVAYQRRIALIQARSKLLISKFRTTSDTFSNYRWDVIVSILSRSYLEKGILEPKTNDVFDTVLGEPASFVKETFNENFQRLLRLVCCGDCVQIWDEAFESLVGTTKKSNLKVETLGTKDKAQIVFTEVREVCLVTVKEFSAPYTTSKSDAEEFVEACVYDKYMF